MRVSDPCTFGSKWLTDQWLLGNLALPVYHSHLQHDHHDHLEHHYHHLIPYPVRSLVVVSTHRLDLCPMRHRL
jgi:hypothetical protein